MDIRKKYISMLSAAAIALLSVGCSEQDDFKLPDASGQDVNFTMSVGDQSRTYYDPDSWTNTNPAGIFWGNPFTDNTPERIAVFGQYPGRNNAIYVVQGYSTPDAEGNGGGNTANKLKLASSEGIQWESQPSDPNTKFTFFAVYPAYTDLNNTTTAPDATSGQVRAYVPGDQQPVKYVVDNKTALSPSTSTSARHIYCYPDMRGAVMVAKSSVTYGVSVPLAFEAISNVLDITINGPRRNNSNDKNFIDIQTVSIKSVSNKAIAGVFDFNAVADDLHAKGNVAANPLALSQVNLQLYDGTSYPRLFNYSNPGVENQTVDQLRVRAFLLPDVDPRDLEISIFTTEGKEFKVAAGKINVDFSNGKIHSLKLPLLDPNSGIDFQPGSWMEQIPENVYITELSIPGSWMSFNTTGNNAYQVGDYKAQYAAGVRAFSLYPVTNSNNADATVNIDGVSNTTLNQVIKYLGEQINPAGKKAREFVVLQFRGVGNSGGWSTGTNNIAALKATLLANQYVYQKEITPETTIGDVAGKVIIKFNVDADITSNAANVGIPAIMSQWEAGTNNTVKTIPLDWGKWNSQGVTTGVGNTGLKWCFSECDRVTTSTTRPAGGPNNASIYDRRQAIDAYIAQSKAEYTEAHDTWFYLLVGGQPAVVNGLSIPRIAAECNTYTWQQLSHANNNCPMGIVMMNYASSTDATYNSTNLIRLLINNNNRALKTRPENGTDQNRANNDGTYSNRGNLAR